MSDDALERAKVAEDYRLYYAQRPPGEVKAERGLLADWDTSDAEVLNILEASEP